MPVPSLPLELISLVLLELRLSFRNKPGESRPPRENILNVALVCKAWKPLGLGIVWDVVLLDSPAATRRAVDHFRAYPHLLQLVRGYDLRDSPSVSGDTAQALLITQRGQRPTLAGEILELWRSGSALDSLVIASLSWLDHDHLLHAMPRVDNLKQLRALCLGMSAGPDPTLHNAICLSLLSTFRHLSEVALVLKFHGARWLDLPPIPRPVDRLRLSLLLLSFEAGHGTDVYRQVASRYLLDLVEPRILTALVLALEPSDLSFVDSLTRFDNLRQVGVHFLSGDVNYEPLLRHFFAVLTSLTQRHLSLIFFGGATGAWPIPGLDTLPMFLSVLPSHVNILQCDRVHFSATAASLPLVVPDKPTAEDIVTTLKMPLDFGDGKEPVEHVLVKLTDGSWRTVKSEKEGEAK
ncbi:hypothetical protein JCM10213_005138 [Rhodosporidiobolus nylandii]